MQWRDRSNLSWCDVICHQCLCEHTSAGIWRWSRAHIVAVCMRFLGKELEINRKNEYCFRWWMHRNVFSGNSSQYQRRAYKAHCREIKRYQVIVAFGSGMTLYVFPLFLFFWQHVFLFSRIAHTTDPYARISFIHFAGYIERMLSNQMSDEWIEQK